VKSGKKWEDKMVIDCLQYRIANTEILQFLKENRFTGLELKLILFWARHPYAKLSIYTIASAMDTARINLRDAMSALVRKCVLNEHCNDNGLTTYALSDDLRARESMNELSKMDWNQIKILEKQLEGEAILT
jgi:hypothetical protein